MYELIYHSKARPNVAFQDIKDILNSAQLFNSKNNVTGCLLYHNHEFIQVLEGEQSIVEELFLRIEKDVRHTNIVVLSRGEKPKRTFGDWSMAFHEFDNEGIERLLFVDNFLAFSKLADKPTRAVQLFHYMAEELLSE